MITVPMRFEETRDREALRALLRRDPVGAAYLLGDLRAPVFEQCRWFGAFAPDGLKAVLLLYPAQGTPTLLPFGDTAAIQGIVESFHAAFPARFYTKLTAEQRPHFARSFRFLSEEPLLVMGLAREPEVSAPPGIDLRLISPTEPLEALLELYEDYPDNFFELSHLENGLYAGAFLGGAPAAVAGTHAYTPEEGIAVLGNIVTAAEYRGRGLCRYVTAFLVRELRRRGCAEIALHVAQENHPAIACYRNAGFAAHSAVAQILAERSERRVDFPVLNGDILVR